MNEREQAAKVADAVAARFTRPDGEDEVQETARNVAREIASKIRDGADDEQATRDLVEFTITEIRRIFDDNDYGAQVAHFELLDGVCAESIVRSSETQDESAQQEASQGQARAEALVV